MSVKNIHKAINFNKYIYGIIYKKRIAISICY